MKLLGMFQTRTLAQLSIALNAMHIVLTLTLPRLFLPTTSAAFPMPVQILIWIEFFLAFVVFLRPIDALITARAYPQSDVDNVSITGSITPQTKRSRDLDLVSSDACSIRHTGAVHLPSTSTKGWSMKVLEQQIEFEREVDGRWIAEIVSLPGVMAYGATKREAESKVQAIARCIIDDEL